MVRKEVIGGEEIELMITPITGRDRVVWMSGTNQANPGQVTEVISKKIMTRSEVRSNARMSGT